MCSNAMTHPPPRERGEPRVWAACARCGLGTLGVDWMRQVWTGYVRCGLHVPGVDWLCQVKTGCGRCGVDVVSAACVRCGLEKSGGVDM